MAALDVGRRERKRQELADRVAAVGFGLFEQRGYEAVTMEQIAAAADVAKGTLYKYFPVKDALLAHQFQHDIASGLSALWQIVGKQHSFAAQMKSVLHASAKWNAARRRYLPYYLRHQFSTANFARPDDTPPHRRSGEGQLFERLCIAGQERGDVRSDLPAAQLAAMLECLYLGAIMLWLGTPNGNLKYEFDSLLALALNGVGR
jgi:AcrR family transcriptional regulator